MAYAKGKKQISIPLDNEIYERIKLLADNDRRSISSYLKLVIENHIKDIDNKK